MKVTELKNVGSDNFFIQEAYNVLRTNIQFCGPDVKVIAITSCEENEGKTTTTLNCAKTFAELGAKVLVIDTDMRKSVMMSKYSTSVKANGLSELLSGLVSSKECIYGTQYPGLSVLFAGRIPPNPLDLLNDKRFAEIISWARENYDYVFIDTTPLALVIDSAIVGPLADGVILIVSDKVRYGTIKKVVEQLKTSNSRILGVVRNRIGRHGKGSKSGYYKAGERQEGFKAELSASKSKAN